MSSGSESGRVVDREVLVIARLPPIRALQWVCARMAIQAEPRSGSAAAAGVREIFERAANPADAGLQQRCCAIRSASAT